MRRFLIYGLVDPRTDEVRYIGRSSSGLNRPKSEASRLKYEPGHKSNWIASLQALGLTYGIRVLEESADAASLNGMERYWIAQAKGLGWRLTNMTIGGEGATGAKRTAETRAKLAASKIGKPKSTMTREKVSAGLKAWWTSRTPEQRKRKPFTEEHLANLSRSHRGHCPTPETRVKLALNWKGRRHTAESRAKMSASLRLANAEGRRTGPKIITLELRAIYSAAAKKANARRWGNPEAHAKASRTLLGNTRGRGTKHTVSDLSRARMSAGQRRRHLRVRLKCAPALRINLLAA